MPLSPAQKGVHTKRLPAAMVLAAMIPCMALVVSGCGDSGSGSGGSNTKLEQAGMEVKRAAGNKGFACKIQDTPLELEVKADVDNEFDIKL